jgi:hypothetical protein
VTSIPSFIIGMKFRSKTGNIGPCILWEKARPEFIDPTKVEFLALDPPASYSFFSLGSWWSSSLGLLPLSSLGGAMIRLELRTTPDRNSSKQKHYETWYTDLGYSGGLYRQKLNIEAKSQEETGTEMSS